MYTHLHTYTYTHTHTHIYICTHAHIHTYIHDTRMFVCLVVHATKLHTDTHRNSAYTYMRINTDKNAVHTDIRHTHTRTHAHTHTHTHTRRWPRFENLLAQLWVLSHEFVTRICLTKGVSYTHMNTHTCTDMHTHTHKHTHTQAHREMHSYEIHT